MTGEMNQAKLEAVEAIIGIIRGLQELDGAETFEEGDLWKARRYASMVINPLASLDDLDKGMMLAAVERGEVQGMVGDVAIMASLSGWLSDRASEQAEAVDLILANPVPGDYPAKGERADDYEKLADGRITIEDFRQRAKSWPRESPTE